MTDRRVFVNPTDWSDAYIVVRGEQGHHLRNVLRARAGDAFEMIDGRGRWARAIVETLSPGGEVNCRIQEQTLTPRPDPDRLVVLQALVRFERFEWVLEKATELGVTRIVPVVTAHTEAKWRDIPRGRVERWQKILIESIKQCRRLHLPALAIPSSFTRAVSETTGSCRILLSEKPKTPSLKSVLKGFQQTRRQAMEIGLSRGVTLAIGPEGGWASEEETLAEQSGFQPASLGEGILRTETAAVASLAILSYEMDE
ncbi:MAG: 16S rRNA (uracil(1498)-N(3))-methyltransferase [Acidobacteriia bacterium]|nr:16S rRNA (uracil(1498)-N(3))-methyltransferase [Terriglobia bacterium]